MFRSHLARDNPLRINADRRRDNCENSPRNLPVETTVRRLMPDITIPQLMASCPAISPLLRDRVRGPASW